MPLASNTSSNNLPSQCTTSLALTDPERVYTWSGCCYTSDCYLATGWYRISGSAGSQLVTNPVSSGGYCGQSYPAWFNGSFPTTTGTTISGVACVNVAGSLCPASYSTTVFITNCGSYYVFYLSPFPYCTVRYCTM